jgi:hypothetical protein
MIFFRAGFALRAEAEVTRSSDATGRNRIRIRACAFQADVLSRIRAPSPAHSLTWSKASIDSPPSSFSPRTASGNSPRTAARTPFAGSPGRPGP